MPLRFHPEPGTVVVCDYNTGFKPPEMVKKRLAIIVSPRLKRRNGLCSVVPLSTSAPNPIENWHHPIVLSPPLPEPWGDVQRWVKADMIATVSFDRLQLPHERRNPDGKRRYIQL